MPNIILPGISSDAAGQVTVDKRMGELLLDLALQLEDTVSAPVDVEHVLAAIVLAAREGDLSDEKPLTKEDPNLRDVLRRHLKTVFEQYGGELGRNDC